MLGFFGKSFSRAWISLLLLASIQYRKCPHYKVSLSVCPRSNYVCFSFCEPGAAGKLQPGAVACFISCHLWCICLSVLGSQMPCIAKDIWLQKIIHWAIAIQTQGICKGTLRKLFLPCLKTLWIQTTLVEFIYPINLKGWLKLCSQLIQYLCGFVLLCSFQYYVYSESFRINIAFITGWKYGQLQLGSPQAFPG